jgi:CBS domain-containing protein
MQLKDIMTKNVQVVPSNASVRDIAKLMKDIDVGSIPVTENNQVIGMVTDRDIVLRSTAEGRNPNDGKASDVMTREFIFGYEDQDIKDAADIMRDHQIRRLPVINRQKELVGIVSLGDLSVDANNDSLSGKTLEDISKPAKPNM